MIISRTPFRVSLFGGGTDFPAWYRDHTGVVVSATIDKYCYVNARFRASSVGGKYQIDYTRRESAGSIDEIRHSSVRECIRLLGISRGLEIRHRADVPAMSGLGSSSAFTVGLLHALSALTGRPSSKRQLADQAIDVEQNWIRECVGSQDQIAAAFGGINRITFGPSDRYDVAPVRLAPAALAALESHLLLCFTGVQRHGPDLAADQQSQASKYALEMDEIASIALEALTLLGQPAVDMPEIGRLVDRQWQIKRRLSALISTPAIADIYDTGMRAGAYGGKLLGAGGGGFMLFVAPPQGHAAIRSALEPLPFVRFRFETRGSEIIYDAGRGRDNSCPGVASSGLESVP